MVELLPTVKIEIAALHGDVSGIVRAIVRNTRTGEQGDGKVFVLPVEDAMRARTGEGGHDAI